MYVSIVLFALAAVLGVTIITKWFSGKGASKAVIYSHGVVAVAGFLLLIYYAVQNQHNFPKVSIILFAIAAVAGLYMFTGDQKGKPHPMAIAVTHALVAVIGFVTLLYFVFA